MEESFNVQEMSKKMALAREYRARRKRVRSFLV